ncbi:hypothetical protein CVT24_005962 [Panaeolus cyanescens]|uniref:MI domain-containing protein n=1 Tax=Panaeolus cyanescens TaxID=181874 RepID=A0A409V8U3_9AGAR|nr:hypothetical protein CVT24_005962 [Panaeolus cyanescens]
MSKSSTTSAPKIPTQLPAKSAWARGPPQATAPSPRSQSPAPSTPIHQTHSRRPSALGQGIPIKDGVSVPRSNVAAVKQGSAVTFGSIDGSDAAVSPPPATTTSSIKSDGIKSFGSVPATSGHTNGKPSISSRSSVVPPPATSSSSTTNATNTATTASTTTSATPPTSSSPSPAAAPPVNKPKIDIKKMFQNPSSAPPSNPSSDSSSPAMRPTNLPSQPPSGHPSHPPASQLNPNFQPFVPSGNMRPQPNGGPNGGPPRSPQYSRQLPNGSGPRNQGGQNGGPPAALPSPRLGPHPHPHNQPPNSMPTPQQSQQPLPPQMPPHMQMPWTPYYYPPPDQQHFMPYGAWYGAPMPMPPHQGPGAQPPGPHMPPHAGMPMSPRNPPANIQAPGTPTLAPAHVNPAHPHPPVMSHPSNSLGGVTSPPPTPSSSSIPPRLNATTNAFVPRATKVTLKSEDGTETTIEKLKGNLHTPSSSHAPLPAQGGSVYRQASPGTPNRRPVSIRMETEEQRNARLAAEEKEAEKERLKTQAEEKKKKEEVERKKRDEEEKKKKEEEAEQARLKKIEDEKKEKERLKKEEEEKKRKEEEEAERKRKEAEEEAKRQEEEAKRLAEEKAKKEEEERLLKEKQEQEKAEQAKREEEERLRREQEEKERAEKEKEKEASAKAEAAAKTAATEEGEVAEEPKSVVADGKASLKEGLRIDTTAAATPSQRPRPGPLDLSIAKTNRDAAPQSALATARIISDINAISYPEGVSSPRPDLNQNVKDGRFRYDRDFLLQFMSVCKEKPAMLPPLDAIGLEPNDQSAFNHPIVRGGSGRSGRNGPPSRQASVNIPYKGPGPFNVMGQFTPPVPNPGRSVSVGGPGMPYNTRPGNNMVRTPSTGGAGTPLHVRTRSKRGEKRGDTNKVPNQQSGLSNVQNPQFQNLEPVAPLQVTANRWDRKALAADQDSAEMVDRKVKALLNKLTMEKFDSISDQIIAWANKSEKEKDGRTLIQVIKLVFEKATDEATWSEMYARLCRKMMEQISSKVQDDGIKNAEGKPIAGGQLFRKYLLNRCQEDFERGWVQKEATAAAAASKALEDEAAARAADGKKKEDGSDEVALYSDEYYAAQKAKRQGLGLIKFIGELFKLQMLTERIMHECVKKLLGNVENPEEEEIESLCKLLATVGSILDTPKARAHLDVYFSRMKELTKSANVSSRMQFMLQDLIELRERKWVSRNAVAAPTTIAQIHEAAAKEKANQEKEAYQRQMSMSRGGSRRGGDRGEFPPNADGWAVAGSGPSTRPPSKAGDLSKFGQISKNQPLTFGPGSVFAGKKGAAENKRDSISRVSSSSNMFSMLSAQGAESSEPAKPEPAQRKRLILQPRSKPIESESQETASPVADNQEDSNDEEEAAGPELSEEDAKKKIKEDSKEFFGVRNLDEAEEYFKLPAKFHGQLIDKLVSTAVESKEADAQLVADFFARAVEKELTTPDAFAEGFTPIAEIVDDIAIDAPKAYQLFGMMVKAASLDDARKSALAEKSMDPEKLADILK